MGRCWLKVPHILYDWGGLGFDSQDRSKLILLQFEFAVRLCVCLFGIYSLDFQRIWTKLHTDNENLSPPHHTIRWWSVCMCESQGGNPIGKVLVYMKSWSNVRFHPLQPWKYRWIIISYRIELEANLWTYFKMAWLNLSSVCSMYSEHNVGKSCSMNHISGV